MKRKDEKNINKEGIELFVVKSFIKSTSRSGVFLANLDSLKQNNTDDFDFTIDTPVASKAMELMEIAPLELVKGSYEDANGIYNDYEFAEYILKKVLKKSSHYAGYNGKGLILLVYVTDWKFIFSEPVIGMLQYWTLKSKHIFERIFYFKPVDEDEGIYNLIYPTLIEHWDGFDTSMFRNRITVNVNPNIK